MILNPDLLVDKTNYKYYIIHKIKGDISLDDIEVTDDYCPTNQFFYCDFEKDTCGFKLETNGYYNWTRRSGKATASLTGPAVDHTVNNIV